MAEGLEWMFRLFDQMSGPAGRMAAEVSGLEKALKKAEGGSKGMGKEFTFLGKASSSVIGGLATIGATMLAAEAAFVAGASAMAVYAFEQLSFRESTLATMK